MGRRAVTSLGLPGAVAPDDDNPDQGVPWHYGDPHREQRLLRSGVGVVDLSNRGVVTVTGPDRLTWLNDLTTQQIGTLPAGGSALALILSPHGHVEHELHVADDGSTTWIICAPGTSTALVAYLRSMQFLLRVEVSDVTADFAVVWEPQRSVDPEHPTWLVPADFAGVGHVEAGADRGGDASKYVAARPEDFVGREVVVPVADVRARLEAAGALAGTWALEALRVAGAVPRIGLETDHRTLPHEVGWIGPGVHLAKGCYRGQEAVARVHNLGHPPRRLVLLHLDGSEGHLPAHGDVVSVAGKDAGWVGTAAWHYELGPVATAIVKRSTPTLEPAVVRTAHGDVAATQETVVLP
ncbi:MAG: folate-binding protein YgfZ [Actinobacteria bacterium]|nr:folate-binding protein YgfZ [Actinomycetota bacterium]